MNENKCDLIGCNNNCAYRINIIDLCEEHYKLWKSIEELKIKKEYEKFRKKVEELKVEK